MILSRFAPSFVAALLLAATLGGCGGKPKPVPVTGKVMYNKTTPAAGALVVFHPLDPEMEKKIGGKPFATVGEDGTFKLTTQAEGDGAPEGEYGVTIVWNVKTEGKTQMSLGDGGGGGTNKLNAKYGDPKNPVFKEKIVKGSTKELLFEVD